MSTKKQSRHALIADLLNADASSGSHVQPPVETRPQVLPFTQISWENFERLCVRLIWLDSAIYDCHKYGQPGDNQQGIDILARRWADSRVVKWAYQCKRYKAFGPSNVHAAMKEIAFDADHYVLLVSSTVSSDVRLEVLKYPNLQIWDAEDLSSKLKSHPQIVKDFFGIAWHRLFCGAAVASADSDSAAVRQLVGLGAQHAEWLHSNLLRVRRLPNRIFSVDQDLESSPAPVNADAAKWPTKRAFERTWTFANLCATNIASALGIESDAAEPEDLSRWMNNGKRRAVVRDLLYQYLQRKCQRIGLAYDSDHRRYYFTPDQGEARSISYQAYRRRATRRVAYPYEGKKAGDELFWVHHAACFTWLSYNRGQFFLRVEPGYAFTSDGVRFLASEDIGPLATRRKSGERNQNVFNHIVFWSEFLSEGQDSIVIDCDGQQLVIEKVVEFGKADFGIPIDSLPVEELALEEDELDLSLMGGWNESEAE